MDSLLQSDFEKQMEYINEVLILSKRLKEKCVQLENDKKNLLEKCTKLEANLERFKRKNCSNCNVLLKKLIKEKEEKETVRKDEKTKLLKTIAKTLENMDDKNTSPVISAHQLFTELYHREVENNLKRKVNILIESDHESENEPNYNILANDTIVAVESDGLRNNCNVKSKGNTIVVPESEPLFNYCLPEYSIQACNKKHDSLKNGTSQHKESKDCYVLKQDTSTPEEEIKKIASSVSKIKQFNGVAQYSKPSLTPDVFKVNSDKTQGVRNQHVQHPCELLESNVSVVIEDNGGLKPVNSSIQEDKGTAWNMKPAILKESSTKAFSGKYLKQMTLSLSKPKKKHDISLSEGFNGGVASFKQPGEEDYVINPSSESSSGRTVCKKRDTSNLMEDPDLTLFDPCVTSTCQPVDNSFDRLPKEAKSPPYKYRRVTVRKKDERMKLPGQDCDECAKFYEAAELNQTQEMRARRNVCSRHRDKFEIRAHTPPGFWDPVLPVTPEEGHES